MSVEKRIKDALLPFGDPVEKSFLYAAADDLPGQYYTFSASSRGMISATMCRGARSGR